MQQKIPLVHLAGVTRLGADHGARIVVFNEMTVTLPTDRICAVLGRRGSGRSTLLRLLNKTLRPDRGSVLTEIQFSIIGNTKSFFQPGMSGLENIKFAARLHGMDPEALTETILGLSGFGSLWEISAGSLTVPRRRAMEMLVAVLLPYDCYLVDDLERVDTEILEQVIQILELRGAGMIFTAQHPKFARQFATCGGVITNQTVYAFPSVNEAVKNYA